MIESIFNVIIFIVFKVVQVILLPIDLLIENAMPELSTALDNVSQYFVYVGTYINWIFDMMMLGSFAIGLLSAYYVFKLTLPLNVWLVKLALKWYNTLKG